MGKRAWGTAACPAAWPTSSICAAFAPVRPIGRAQTVHMRGSGPAPRPLSSAPRRSGQHSTRPSTCAVPAPGHLGTGPPECLRAVVLTPQERQQPQQVWGPLWLSAFSANGPRTHVPPFPGRRELRDFLGSALLGGEGGARSCVRYSAPHRPSLSATRCVRRLPSARVKPPAGGPRRQA